MSDMKGIFSLIKISQAFAFFHFLPSLFPFCYAFLYFLLLTFLRSSVYNKDMNRKSTKFEVEIIGTDKAESNGNTVKDKGQVSKEVINQLPKAN